MKQVMKQVILFSFIGLLGVPLQADINFSNLEKLPVQEGGRKKPYVVLARETSLGLTGKTSIEVEGKRIDAMDWVTRAWLQPQVWRGIPLILVNNLQLKKDAGLPLERKLFRYDELVENMRIRQLLTEVSALRAMGGRVPLSAEQREVSEIGLRLALFESLLNGTLFRVLPGEGVNWTSLSPGALEFQAMQEALVREDQDELNRTVALLDAQSAHDTTLSRKIALEVIYQRIHPFRLAWIFYTVAGIVLLATWWRLPNFNNKVGTIAPSDATYSSTKKNSEWGVASDAEPANPKAVSLASLGQDRTIKETGGYVKTAGYVVGWIFAFAGFALQVSGFIMRVYISGRPPVSNMYESIIWVAFGTVLFGLIFEAIYRSRFFLLGAIPVAVVSLILADVQPLVLNPSITPLVAVLQSNFWLTTHVLTITLSYAAFALALGVAHIALGQVIFGRQPGAAIYNYIYKALQVGVLLLACGTILGAVWANYSWGRFWDWDPKETWALVALLVYLLILHGRIAGAWRGFGTAVGAVLGFQAIIMAWYGVNFVLGVGLHSYGFGSGGMQYAMLFVALEIVLVMIAALRYRRKQVSRSSVVRDGIHQE